MLAAMNPLIRVDVGEGIAEREAGPRRGAGAAPPFGRQQAQDIRAQALRTRRKIDLAERQRDVTTEEAEQIKAALDSLVRDAAALAGGRPVAGAGAQDLLSQGRSLVRRARALRELPESLHRRAERGRSVRGLQLVTGFQVRPTVIRVGEHEAAGISFVLTSKAESAQTFVLSSEGQEGTSYRFFNLQTPVPGYHVAVWDGTFDGSRNRPPQPGTYRVHLMLSGKGGRREHVIEQVRVENPGGATVLPRTASGLALVSLTFDGSRATLTDSGGNRISMRAVSGLKPNNRRNPDGRDYTKPQHQHLKDRGPIPVGVYSIRQNAVQHPRLVGNRLLYPSGQSATGWGPIRAPLIPMTVSDRSGFFLHLDVTDDGTAGCIGIHPSEEGRFNQVMSLISRMPNTALRVEVNYP